MLINYFDIRLPVSLSEHTCTVHLHVYGLSCAPVTIVKEGNGYEAWQTSMEETN